MDETEPKAGLRYQPGSGPEIAMNFEHYDPQSELHYDETFAAAGRPRAGFESLISCINELNAGELHARQQAAERALLNMGITFTLQDERGGVERIFPFDIIPRIVAAAEWRVLEAGLEQRVVALNLFLQDLYGPQKILHDGVVPRYLIESCPEYRKQCVGNAPPAGVYCHISGIDLVRDRSGTFYVLEDNVRCPSGVSYVLENREVLKRTFPRIFDRLPIRRVDDYPRHLLETLRALATDRSDDPQVVVLTPGRYNSAYYEHAFLAQQMGVELVEPHDLVVSNDEVYMRTTAGFERVDVIYRRVNDDYLDPEVFRADSLLGVPGLMRAYLSGRVALANAPGTGVADDKAIYSYVPDIIRYYLAQDAIIPNVPTYVCADESQRAYVVAHLNQLVVKATDGAGGYGMLIGPHSHEQERTDFARKILANPRGYIAQPTLSLSRVPTIVGDEIDGRHVDLRPFVLYAKDMYVLPGGLTRVALKPGSLVVNSSQGGGSKDTWVLAE